jgi:hypothetical protein
MTAGVATLGLVAMPAPQHATVPFASSAHENSNPLVTPVTAPLDDALAPLDELAPDELLLDDALTAPLDEGLGPLELDDAIEEPPAPPPAPAEPTVAPGTMGNPLPHALLNATGITKPRLAAHPTRSRRLAVRRSCIRVPLATGNGIPPSRSQQPRRLQSPSVALSRAQSPSVALTQCALSRRSGALS